METLYCSNCNVPINYDNYINGREISTIVRDNNGDIKCSFCLKNSKDLEFKFRNTGQNEWVMDMVINVFNTDFSLKKIFGKFGSKILSKSSNLYNLSMVLDSIPKKNDKATFDAVVLYSGGKDSSYMLINLAKRKIKVCAWMLDQGYQSPAAIENAQNLCKSLNIPLFIERPDKNIVDKLFKIGFNIKIGDDPTIVKSAMTYGSACWPCFAMISSHVTRFCAKNDIRLCFIGTQEGQNRLDLGGKPVLAGKGLPKIDFLVSKFMTDFHEHTKRIDLPASHILERENNNAVLIPFYEFIKKPIYSDQITFLNSYGWSMPNNTGACSTNCMMNELGRKIMRENFGFDLYEIIESNEKRIGNSENPHDSNHLQPTLDEGAVKIGAKLIGFEKFNI